MGNHVYILMLGLFMFDCSSVSAENVSNILNGSSHITADINLKNGADYVSIITAITALVAVVLGPIVSLYIARKQIYIPINYQIAEKAIDKVARFLSIVFEVEERMKRNLIGEAEKTDKVRELRDIYYSVRLLCDDSSAALNNLYNSMEFILGKIALSQRDYETFKDDVEVKKNLIYRYSRESVNKIIKDG